MPTHGTAPRLTVTASRSRSSTGNRDEGILDLLQVKHYPFLLAAGVLFDFARVGIAFLAPYYVNEATHSPRLVQLTGAASWCFLIAGPCFGVISDRVDRRLVVVLVLMVMAGMTAIIALLLVVPRV